MRKRRRLADKLTIMVCAVLVAVSAFFYAPMDVSAEEIISFNNEYINDSPQLLSDSEVKSFVGDFQGNALLWYFTNPAVNLGSVDLSSRFDISSDNYYSVVVSGVFYQDLSWDTSSYPNTVTMSNSLSENVLVNGVAHAVSYGQLQHSFSKVVYFKGSDCIFDFTLITDLYSAGSSSLSFNSRLDLSFSDLSVLSDSQSSDYQNGYNAGYSAGEQAGYGNGYSQGFVDGEASVDNDEIYNQGFEAGKDSVDTQSYYDAGYQAGYQVAYQDGYDSGYAAGLKSVQSSSGSWQPYKFIGTNIPNVKQYGSSFFVAPYGLDDMEEYSSGANGYYHNTVPSVYDGYSTINYIIPFDGVTSVDSDKFRFIMNISNLSSSFNINSGSASFQNTLISSDVEEVFVTFNGKKYYGNIGKYTGGTDGYVTFDFIVDDFIPPVDLQTNSFLLTFVVHNTLFANIDASQYKFVGASCTPYVSFNVGSSVQGYAFRVRPYVANDRTSASIKSQTDTLTDGFNDSHGNSVNNEFSSGLNDFETAEDSLFATATTGLKDFTFFDIQSVPAMVTGMSFVGSIMSGWFAQAGGASGVGIVLSILFSIMLVAMVLGLYRWYQSKGGKD